MRLNDKTTPEEMARDIEDHTINNECSNCGNCCTAFIPLTREEADRIAKHLLRHPEVINHRHIANGTQRIQCPFRDNVARRCTIHDIRPRVCRRFLCNMTPEALAKNKDENLDRAYYNGRDTERHVSLQALFFNDIEWELQMYASQFNCKTKEELMRVLNIHKPFILTKAIALLNDIKAE